MALGVQVVFRAEDDRILAPTDEARRAWSRTIREVGRRHGLFGYGLADTHGHAGLLCESVSSFVHDARVALSARLDLHLVAPSRSPIRDTWHAYNVLRYMHRQAPHHGVATDPFREGTSLPDLLGMRPSGLWLAERVRAALPRVTRTALLEHWGISEISPEFKLALLPESGAAAIGTRLTGRSQAVVAARRACVRVGLEAGVTVQQIAEALDLAERTVRDLRAASPDPRMVAAVRLQMGVRVAIAPVDEPIFVAERPPWRPDPQPAGA